MNRLLTEIMMVIILFMFVVSCAKEELDSPVIARVNDNAITEKDFLKEINRVPEWARDQFKNDEGKGNFLDELIKRELIYQNAKKMRLHKNEEYLKRVEEFEKMTLVSLSLKKEVDDKVRVDESEIKDFFDNNQDKFTIGTKIKASHILVSSEDEANTVLTQLNQGEDFSSLAKKFSKDSNSAKKGGDLGYFGKGRMVPEFERAALSLKPGEVSKPVRSRFGYHIIKLTDIQKGEPANFEQSKESIQRELINQKRKVLFDAYIESLRESSKIDKSEDIIAGIPLPWEKAEEQQSPPQQSPAEAK